MKKIEKTEEKTSTRKPFFARFLENQEMEQANGGRPPYQTLKYPSDNDEGGPVS
jgi:hypothetical protein